MDTSSRIFQELFGENQLFIWCGEFSTSAKREKNYFNFHLDQLVYKFKVYIQTLMLEPKTNQKIKFPFSIKASAELLLACWASFPAVGGEANPLLSPRG